MFFKQDSVDPIVVGAIVEKEEDGMLKFFLDMKFGNSVYSVEITQPVHDYLDQGCDDINRLRR